MSKLKIHPILDEHLTHSFHMRYGGLHKLYTENKHVANALKLMLTMASSVDRSAVSTAADNARSAREIVNFQFATACVQRKKCDASSNLLEILESTLKEEGWGEAKIKETLTEFEENQSVAQFLSNFEHLPLIKSCGFPSLQIFKHFVRDTTGTANAKKRAELELTPRFLLSNLKAIDGLQTDGPRRFFYGTLAKYVSAVETPHPSNPSAARKAGNDRAMMATLATIQGNCILVGTSALKSWENPITCPLEEYSARPHFAKRWFSQKQLGKVSKALNAPKILSAASDVPEWVSKPEDDSFPICFNCYKCPTSGGNGERCVDAYVVPEDGGGIRISPESFKFKSKSKSKSGSASASKSSLPHPPTYPHPPFPPPPPPTFSTAGTSAESASGSACRPDPVVRQTHDTNRIFGPAAAHTSNPGNSKLSFVDEVKAKFNVHRLLPISSVEEAKRHENEIHLQMDLTFVNDAKSHTNLFLCEYCREDEEMLEFSFNCCLAHIEVRLFSVCVCVYVCVCVRVCVHAWMCVYVYVYMDALNIILNSIFRVVALYLFFLFSFFFFYILKKGSFQNPAFGSNPSL